MPDTYVEGGVDAISRLRELIADTAAAISDVRLQRWLDDTRGIERLRIYLPTGTDGATAATVSVAMDGEVLTLTLQRTTSPAEDADELALAPSDSIVYVRDVIDWIGSLEKGWRVGVSIGEDEDWCDPDSWSWVDSLVTTSRVARFAPAINLAVLADPIAAYGGEDDAAELSFYRMGAAAKRAIALQDVGSVSTRREGNVSRTFRGAADALGDEIRRLAGEGIYGV